MLQEEWWATEGGAAVLTEGPAGAESTFAVGFAVRLTFEEARGDAVWPQGVWPRRELEGPERPREPVP